MTVRRRLPVELCRDRGELGSQLFALLQEVERHGGVAATGGVPGGDEIEEHAGARLLRALKGR